VEEAVDEKWEFSSVGCLLIKMLALRARMPITEPAQIYK
jgi:hypothetical protein